MSYEDVKIAITDARESVRAARKMTAIKLAQLLNDATSPSVRVPDELTDLICDLASYDPTSRDLTVAEYAHELMRAFSHNPRINRYVGTDELEGGITFVVR